MALVSKSIPNLINGVSQQPPALRLPTQGETQENGLSDVVDGLKKRPPTKFLNKLVKVKESPDANAWTAGSALTTTNTETLDVTNCYITTYKRSQTEQYTVVIEPHSTTPVIYVYDINGNLNYQSNKASWKGDGTWCVDNTDSTAYLADITKEEMTSTSVADATFIVNKSKAVAKVTTPNPPSAGSAALVYLKSVNYERIYKLRIESKVQGSVGTLINGATTSGPANTGTNPSSTKGDNQLKVSKIINELRSSIINHHNFNAGAHTSGSLTDVDYFVSESRYNYYPMSDGNMPIRSLYKSTGYDANPTNIQVTCGGVFIPYAGASIQAAYDADVDANTEAGWVYDSWSDVVNNARAEVSNTNKKYILIPKSFLRDVSYSYFNTASFTRPTVYIYTGSATITLPLLMQPAMYNSEAFFVLTANALGTFSDFNIYASDDDGGTNLRVFKDTAKSFTDLPNQCIDGFRIQVAGDNNKKEDNFYVYFDGSGGSGVWKETVGSGIINDFDLTTMPHTLK